MENRAAYAAIMGLNDESLDLHKRIKHELTEDQVEALHTSLCKFAGKLEEALKKHHALSPDREADLAEVYPECNRALQAAKDGDRNEKWAALTRAYGRINSVMENVMDRMG